MLQVHRGWVYGQQRSWVKAKLIKQPYSQNLLLLYREDYWSPSMIQYKMLLDVLHARWHVIPLIVGGCLAAL